MNKRLENDVMQTCEILITEHGVLKNFQIYEKESETTWDDFKWLLLKKKLYKTKRKQQHKSI